MRFHTLIRGATAVTGDHAEIADVGIAQGKIAAIGDLAGAPTENVIEARGLHLFAGAIDSQVHFREPGNEHKEDIESGTRAAVMGGVTTVFEMPNTQPTTTTREALEDKIRRAQGRSWCNIAFFMGASRDNIAELGELENLPGTPGIKIFMGSSTGTLLVDDDEDLRRVLRSGKKRCPVHAEDEQRLRSRKELWERGELDLPKYIEGVGLHPYLRDAEVALLATQRILALSGDTGRPVHILHVSSFDELPLIEQAKKEGLGTSAEITPQHLWFAAPDCYARHGTLAQMNPPIRTAEHREALRKAVRAGLFDVFGSDHAPHTREEKSKPYPESPSGVPGVQTLLPVLLTLNERLGLIDLPRFARMLSENPARLYGLQNKGFLREGFDADLCLVDLRSEFTVEPSWLQSKCGWSPFEGERLIGRPIHVWVNGVHTVRGGELAGPPLGSVATFGSE